MRASSIAAASQSRAGVVAIWLGCSRAANALLRSLEREGVDGEVGGVGAGHSAALLSVCSARIWRTISMRRPIQAMTGTAMLLPSAL